jgi:hypothetical protein
VEELEEAVDLAEVELELILKELLLLCLVETGVQVDFSLVTLVDLAVVLSVDVDDFSDVEEVFLLVD